MADYPRPSTVADQRRTFGAGFTLVELVISCTMLVVVLYIVTTLIMTGTTAQKFAQRQARVTEIAQDLSDDMRRELTASVRVFHDDAAGAGYLGLLDFRGAKAGIPYRLPTLNEVGLFEKEPSNTKLSGNALMLARHAWTTTFTPTPSQTARTYRIDVYRVVHYYLAPEGQGPRIGSPLGLNLIKWVGEPLADGDQIDKITDPADQLAVAQHLRLATPDDDGIVHPAVEVVWRRNAAPTEVGALRHVQASGSLANSPQPPRDPGWAILRNPKYSSNNLLYYRHHSVATNFAPSRWGVSRFSTSSNTQGGFPHGFEVQLVGPTAARQVLVRLVVVTTNTKGHPAHASIQTVAIARDI